MLTCLTVQEFHLQLLHTVSIIA